MFNFKGDIYFILAQVIAIVAFVLTVIACNIRRKAAYLPGKLPPTYFIPYSIFY